MEICSLIHIHSFMLIHEFTFHRLTSLGFSPAIGNVSASSESLYNDCMNALGSAVNQKLDVLFPSGKASSVKSSHIIIILSVIQLY